MRHFVLFSNKGKTSPKFKDLMKAGRLDIVVNSILHAFFISNGLRAEIDFHIILNGPPDPPKHLQIVSNKKTPWSKKDIGTLIRIALWKYKPKEKVEALPGVFIEKKSFFEVIEELMKAGFHLYLLDPNGVLIDDVKIKEEPIFVLGDHLGLPRKEKRFIKKNCEEIISLGNIPYFSSQCIAIINHYLDKIGLYSKYWETKEKFKEL